jgi:hypothetical protein
MEMSLSVTTAPLSKIYARVFYASVCGPQTDKLCKAHHHGYISANWYLHDR